MHDKTLAELSAGLAAGEFSSVELTEHYLQRIADLDGQLNSYVTVTPELALEQAQAADSRIAAGDVRSEERRVGKECRSRWSPYH